MVVRRAAADAVVRRDRRVVVAVVAARAVVEREPLEAVDERSRNVMPCHVSCRVMTHVM